MSFTRRQFLGTSAAAVVAAGTMARSTVFGANDRIGVCCVGIHGRGKSHIRGFSENPGSEVVALCDVDEKVLEERAKEFEAAGKPRPKTYTDMRQALEDPDVQVVTIATPNHWHSLGTVWAVQAGKDVYVEKPISHSVWEGRQVANLAEQSDRIVQHGTQRRAEPAWQWVIQRLREGVIGDLYMARALCFKRRDSIGMKEDQAPPAELHWDLWQGPAKDKPYNPNYVHYNWHWFWDYGNGDLGNQGVHQMDVAVWGMNKGLPSRVQSMGGRYGYEDQGQTANTQACNFQYDDGTMLVFEVRGRATNGEGDTRIGNLFYGSNGYFSEGDGTFYDIDGKAIESIPEEAKQEVKDAHYALFLEAVRTRDKSKVPATALDGHLASAHCHLGNVAYRLGRSLQFDPKTERFVGDDEADVMLRRAYREGFEVPEIG